MNDHQGSTKHLVIIAIHSKSYKISLNSFIIYKCFKFAPKLIISPIHLINKATNLYCPLTQVLTSFSFLIPFSNYNITPCDYTTFKVPISLTDLRTTASLSLHKVFHKAKV